MLSLAEVSSIFVLAFKANALLSCLMLPQESPTEMCPTGIGKYSMYHSTLKPTYSSIK